MKKNLGICAIILSGAYASTMYAGNKITPSHPVHSIAQQELYGLYYHSSKTIADTGGIYYR